MAVSGGFASSGRGHLRYVDSSRYLWGGRGQMQKQLRPGVGEGRHKVPSFAGHLPLVQALRVSLAFCQRILCPL